MALEDLTLNEVACCECGKPISAIPAWLSSATVKFQCEECRQKHPRVPGMADIEPRRGAASHDADEIAPLGGAAEEPAEEDADEDLADEAEDLE